MEVIGGMQRFTVRINTHETHVVVIAGVIEIVGVAAEKRGLLARREYQAHVLVAAVLVQPELSAVVERNHLAAPFLRVAVHASLLEPARGGAARGIIGGPAQPCRGLVDVACHVGSLDQLLDLHRRAFRLLVTGRRIEVMAHQVLLRAGQAFQAPDHAMMIGQHQAVGRHERAGAAFREPHRGKLDMLYPGGRRRKVEILLQRGNRQVGQGPHALARQGGGGAGNHKQ